MAPSSSSIITTDLPLQLIAKGKVRDVYDAGIAEGEEHAGAILFVATDRISAFDVVLDNGIPEKGPLLHALSTFWFSLLTPSILPSHILSTSFSTFPPTLQARLKDYKDQLDGRSMLVRRAKVLPIEAIVRGYITGSGWKEYVKKGTVHGLELPKGLRESDEIPGGPIFTPSTKAEQGDHDMNIHPDQAVDLLGPALAKAVSDAALDLYRTASTHAASRGIILADTKFEFGLISSSQSGLPPTTSISHSCLPTTGESLKDTTLMLVDEVLTPDSSRFWSRESYSPGKGQASWDKQYVRDWLQSNGKDQLADGASQPVRLPEEVVVKTREKYQEAYERITGNQWRAARSGGGNSSSSSGGGGSDVGGVREGQRS